MCSSGKCCGYWFFEVKWNDGSVRKFQTEETDYDKALKRFHSLVEELRLEEQMLANIVDAK